MHYGLIIIILSIIAFLKFREVFIKEPDIIDDVKPLSPNDYHLMVGSSPTDLSNTVKKMMNVN